MFRPVFCGVHHINIKKKSVFQKKKYILIDDNSLYLQKGSLELCLKVGDFHLLMLTLQKVKKPQIEERQRLRLTAFSRTLLSVQSCFPFPCPKYSAASFLLPPLFFSEPLVLFFCAANF